MTAVNRSLAGFHGLRGAVLVALKKAQPLTAKELAEQFGVTPNALRRHLKALEEEGLVHYRREVRGVGGPVYAYSLSGAGDELFPRTYDEALAGALELVREQHGVDGLVRLFERQWAEAAEALEAVGPDRPLLERAQTLAEWRSAQGYMAEAAEESTGAVALREHNCAIRAVAERFPEICAAEARFFAEVLDAAVERRAHILRGCNACEYVVRARGAEDVAVPAAAGPGRRSWTYTGVEQEKA